MPKAEEGKIAIKIGKRVIEMQLHEWAEGSALRVVGSDEAARATTQKRPIIGHGLDGSVRLIYEGKAHTALSPRAQHSQWLL
jgi:hypothetical protein